jgi:8-oxo-dGTP diphosphatase
MLLVVAAALMNEDGNVLVQCRPKGKPWEGFWEFPGGKVDAGETPEHALIRELHEELGIDVLPSSLSPLSFITHGLGEGITNQPASDSLLLLLLYRCTQWEGNLHAREHQQYVWVDSAMLRRLPLLPADVPLIKVIFP